MSNNIKKVINASGKMTILGGSIVSDKVATALVEGATNFYVVKELNDYVSLNVAKKFGFDAGYVVGSASSGICQSVAASILKNYPQHILNPFTKDISEREIVIAKGHVINYGTSITIPIQMGGGQVVEAGYANMCKKEHLEEQINKSTTALIYVKSHHCVQKEICELAIYSELAQKYNIDLIVDIAAETDVEKYNEIDASAFIMSGTKALEGPTSGIVLGKKDFINSLKQQDKGIGRVLKVGKENILGLNAAVDQYEGELQTSIDQQKKQLKVFNKKMREINGLTCNYKLDDAGRNIIRSQIKINPTITKITANSIIDGLKENDPCIYVRGYYVNDNIIEIDARDLTDDNLDEIYKCIKKIIKDKNENKNKILQ